MYYVRTAVVIRKVRMASSDLVRQGQCVPSDAFVEVQEAILTGHALHLAVVTNDVMRATGRPPGSFPIRGA